jgi:RNA polymerase sigma-54 factor
MALEQRIKTELELNPLLEEAVEEDIEVSEEQEQAADQLEEMKLEQLQESPDFNKSDGEGNPQEEFGWDEYVNDDPAGYKTWGSIEDEDKGEMPQPEVTTMAEQLMSQLMMLNLKNEYFLLGEEIIGNIDEDGYLNRQLEMIVDDVNLTSKLNLTVQEAEYVLGLIQHLDPVGIGARSLKECLLIQLKAGKKKDSAVETAIRVLEECYDDFVMRHYEDTAKKLHVTLDELKAALEIIQHLNPKPGEGQFTPQENYVTPDFVVQNLDGEFIISLNDKNVPPLRINKGYRQILANKQKNGVSVEARDFVRKKIESARWFINSIYQRRQTMLKVMRAIVDRQRGFFETGEGLKPMIYKDIADVIHMDISTISRVVNGKYVQTDYGVHELRSFFSEAISMSDGEEVSNKEVKIVIRKIIDAENPHNPLNDDEITSMLRSQGFNIARRTVAKYRESMMLPVARMRRRI